MLLQSNYLQPPKPPTNQAHSSRAKEGLEAKVQYLTDMMQYHMTQQRKFYEFSSNVYKWQRRLSQLSHPKVALPIPIFPLDLLVSFDYKEPQPSSPSTEPVPSTHEPENEEDYTECPPPPSQMQNTATSRKGKEIQQPKFSKKKQKARASAGASGTTLNLKLKLNPFPLLSLQRSQKLPKLKL